MVYSLLVHESPKHIEKLVSCLDLQHPYEMQRVTVAAIFAQVKQNIAMQHDIF